MAKKKADGSRDGIKAGAQSPGAALKALRTENGWTLADVSQRTGVQVSTLSKLENGNRSFSYEKLLQISRGLGLDITELLKPRGSASLSGKVAGRRSISRRDDGVIVKSAASTYKHLAIDLLNRNFAPIVGEIHARSTEDYPEFLTHPGEEFVYVLQGTLELHTSVYAPVRLEEGESMYFDSEMPHAYVAAGPGPCRILSICSDESDGG